MRNYILSFQLNEAAIGKMFSDIADEDDPTVATMEGEFQLRSSSFITIVF